VKCVSSPAKSFIDLETYMSCVELNVRRISYFEVEMADIGCIAEFHSKMVKRNQTSPKIAGDNPQKTKRDFPVPERDGRQR
jgi:hypothetical protein